MSLDFMKQEAVDVSQLPELLRDNVQQLISLRERITKGEELLKELKAEEDTLSSTVIPEQMQALNYSEIKLANGTKVSIKEDLFVAMPSASKQENALSRSVVMDWLRNNGGEALIKLELAVIAQEDNVKEYMERLKNVGVPFVKTEDVNTNSLKSFINDMLGRKKGSVQRIKLEDVPKEINPFLAKKTIIS